MRGLSETRTKLQASASFAGVGESVSRPFHAALDRRLDPTSDAPLGVALSGGGDSLALLHLVAERLGGRRPLPAFVVDHGLHPDSAAWTRFACNAAGGVGATPVPLRWTGDKPTTGLPAAARRARHALIADAARARGCRVVLFGHTADDLAEAAAMRAAGSTVPDPVEWSPSPVWPEGRGVFMLRPLLGASRAELRAYLTDLGETWLEDPANTDLRFARSRVRNPLPRPGGEGRVRGSVRIDGTAVIRGADPSSPALLPSCEGRRESWIALPRDLSPDLLARAFVCVSGGERPPRAEAVERVIRRLRTDEPFAATLAGARVQAEADHVLLTREAGRARFPERALDPGVPAVWDGRYELVHPRPATVRALAGLAAQLSPGDRLALRAVPAAARPTLPVLIEPGRGPVLATNLPETRSLVAERLAAACGQIAHEREIDVPPRGAVNSPPLC